MMNRSILRLICVSAILILPSCGRATESDNSVTPTPTPTPTATTTPVATISEAIERYDATAGSARLDYGTSLLGSDANANGVRDDVDGYIQTLSLAETERRSLMQWARSLQSLLSINSADSAAVAAGILSMDRAGDCVAGVIANGNVAELMNSVTDATYNTPERLSAYMRFDDVSSGKSVEIPASGNCD